MWCGIKDLGASLGSDVHPAAYSCVASGLAGGPRAEFKCGPLVQKAGIKTPLLALNKNTVPFPFFSLLTCRGVFSVVLRN